MAWERPVDVALASCAVNSGGSVFASAQGSADVALVMGFDPTGQELWRRQLREHQNGAVSAYDGGALVTALGSGSSTVYRLAEDGSCSWELPFGQAYVWDLALTADGGALVIAEGWGPFDLGGFVEEGPSPGALTSFVVRVDPAGRILWVRFLQGVSLGDFAVDYLSVTTPGLALSGDDFFVRGTPTYLTADLGPSSGSGTHPATPFVARFANDGTHLWTRQLGFDPIAIAATPGGSVIVTNMTSVRAYGPSAPPP